MRYWDSSALLPLVTAEPRSGEIESLIKQDPSLLSWWGTPVECYSGLWRLKREGTFTEPDFQNVKEELDRLMAEVDFIPPSSFLRDRSLRLLSHHSLRAGDALHLASALHWTGERTQGVGFVCLDDRLRKAALAEGFTVLPQAVIL